MRDPLVVEGHARVRALSLRAGAVPAGTTKLTAALSGKALGPYRIRRRLGKGGMGEVYSAHDARLNRTVALKLLPAELARDPDHRARFRREARAVAALDHPNIVRVYSVEEIEGHHFITMELVAGRSLLEIGRDGPLPLERLLPLAIQIGRGIACAHAAGVIHRDLKPANVMVRDDGVVKLLDFGMAKLLDPFLASDPEAATLHAGPSSAGLVLGTAPYMAPEQALGREVDARTDLFALGVVLYQLATGRSPFEDSSLAGTFDRILNQAPVAANLLRPGLPSGLVAVLERALQKDPARRYQSTGELIADLEGLEGGRTPDAASEETRSRLSSIAVLPFTDLSAEHDQEYFCQGLAEELIGTLTRLAGLRVVARSSAFALEGQEVAEVGRRLGVETVLKGSVRKAGSRLRISAQLIETADGGHLWSERFDRELKDVFEIQDEIASTIAGRLEVELGGAAPRPARPARSLDAYDAYLRGLYAMNRWTVDWVRRAQASFSQAIEKDPAFAPAHAALAECYLWLYSGIGLLPARECVPQARQAAQTAVELDPGLAAGHKGLGLIAMNHDWDRHGARLALERAVALNPGAADARLWNAWRLALLEACYDDAFEELSRAERLNPLDLQIKTLIGYVYSFSGQVERAAEQFRQVLALDPHFAFAHYALGDACGHGGQHPDAIAHYERAIELGGRSVNHIGVLAHAAGLAGDHGRARALLGELEAASAHGYVSAMWLALAHLGLGEAGAALDCLERAHREHDGSLVLITSAREFDPLRQDRRFQALLGNMGLPQRAKAGLS